MEFLDPSHKAIASKGGQFVRKYEFPFDLVPLGKSFAVAKDDVKNINVLRAMATRFGKRLKRSFRVIDHGESGFEVYYKADTSEKPEAAICI